MEVRNSWLNIIIVLGCCSNFFCREHCRTQNTEHRIQNTEHGTRNTAGWKPQQSHTKPIGLVMRIMHVSSL